MEVKRLAIDKKTIKKSARKIENNDLIAEFYERMSEERDSERLHNVGERVKGCFKLWDIDYYRKQSVKDILRINLCKDKFCKNCQNLLSMKRYNKYKPELDKLAEKYAVYHVVITVPNVGGAELESTLNRMYEKFPYLARYMQGVKKCKNINFRKYGFAGAVRSLEITTKQEKGKPREYHPHFHCLFLMDKAVNEKRVHINDYSFTKGSREVKQKFTDLEILLQKCWRLLYDGERLTAEAVGLLPQGYSVKANKVINGDYKEVFKYTLKESFDELAHDYETFETLYGALYRRKIIQGYGLLNRFKFEEEITDEEVEEIYELIQIELNSKEHPERQYMRLKEVFAELDEREDITYISKNRIREYIRNE